MSALLGFSLQGLLFWILARCIPCDARHSHRQKDLLIDLMHCGIMTLYAGTTGLVFVVLGALALHGFDADTITQAFQNRVILDYPIALQVFTMFIIADIWTFSWHRAFHSARLWKFHKLHHSPVHMDWLSSYRFHPVNQILAFAPYGAILFWAGFGGEAFFWFGILKTFHAFLTHANINWNFGWFNYVIASPIYHRWHHSAEPAAWGKNFASTFPILDLLAGSYYMPKDRLPLDLGVGLPPIAPPAAAEPVSALPLCKPAPL
jgi:sterol desaturase/sphingolipid hydroxylase (fatty acid hydroxylase superfamily)